jgi:hypothetical protein
VIVLLLDVALLVGLAVGDKAKGWSIVDLPWWAWLLLAAPALVLMLALLTAPLAELSPARRGRSAPARRARPVRSRLRIPAGHRPARRVGPRA